MSATRRGLLAGAAVLTVAPVMARAAVTTAAHPDAELLRLSDRFVANERAIQAEPCDAECGSQEEAQAIGSMRALVDVQHALCVQMGRLRAATADGVQARAYCLAFHNADDAFSMDYPDTTTGRLLRWLMRDAAALGGASVKGPATSPDAALLEACAAFDKLERGYADLGGDWPAGSPEEDAAEEARACIADDQAPFVNRICEMVAVTREGQSARARSLASWNPNLLKDGPGDAGECLTAAIVRDLIG